MKLPTILFATILLLAASSASFAADGPAGIGFVQAEEGTWWCRDSDPEKALACAAEKCATEAAGQECHATRWCKPAGWTGLMVVWLPEFHSTTILCGASSQAAATAALKALCESAEEFTRCEVVRFIDPDGGEHEISDLSWPGPAVSDEPPAE